MQGRNLRLLAIAAALLSVFVASCGGSGESSSGSGGASSPGVTDTEIKLGAWLPLTGPLAPHGLAQKAGYDAYFKEVNDDGGVNGRKINWVTEDNAYDPTQTVTVARRLVQQEKVFALVGANGTPQSEATFPFVIDQNKVPLITPYGGAVNWFEPVKKPLFGTNIPYEYQADILAKWMADDGVKNAVAVPFALAPGQNAAKQFASSFKDVGGNATTNEVPQVVNDWAPIVRSLTQKNPDAVVFFNDISSAVGFLQEAARQDFKIPVYAWGPWASQDVIKLAGGAADDLRAVSATVVTDHDAPEVDAYKEALKASAPDLEPDLESMFTYASAQITGEALKKIEGTPTREKLIAAFEGIKGFDTGILPPVSFDGDHHLATACMFQTQIKDGAWTQLSPDYSCSDKADAAALPNEQ